MKRNPNQRKGMQTLLSKVSLATTDNVTGTVFYKQLVKYGEWVNPLFPVESMTLDYAWGEVICKNFNAGTAGRVPVPLDHTDYVEANTGEVLKLENKEDGLYGYLDIRRPETVMDILDGLIFDVSVSFDWDYVDTANGDSHGATLLHVALVNNPYLSGMKPFEKIQDVLSNFTRKLASGAGKRQPALARSMSDSVILFSTERNLELNPMKNAIITNTRDFAVEVKFTDGEGAEQTATIEPGATLEVPKEQAEAVNGIITGATKPETEEEKTAREEQEAKDLADKEAADKAEAERLAQADKDAAAEAAKPQAEKDAEELSRLRAENAAIKLSQSYDKLLLEGKITPAQKEKFMALSKIQTNTVSLSDGATTNVIDIVTGILSAGPKLINFSENGTKNGEETTAKLSEDDSKGLQAMGVDPKVTEKYIKEGRIPAE